MYASGSTWLFNAVRALVTALHPSQSYATIYLETLPHLARLPLGPTIVKSHYLAPQLARFVEARSDRILLSLRDPRDAVTSLMQYMGQSFPNALQQVERSALICSRYAGHERTFLFIYEHGFTEQPETFDRLAAAFDSTLPIQIRQKLFTDTRRKIIENQITQLEALPTSWRNPATGDLLDKVTQWHFHHAGRTGEIGRWRNFLSHENIIQIERRMAPFMKEFGYTR